MLNLDFAFLDDTDLTAMFNLFNASGSFLDDSQINAAV
jgi:hypothetical protein